MTMYKWRKHSTKTYKEIHRTNPRRNIAEARTGYYGEKDWEYTYLVVVEGNPKMFEGYSSYDYFQHHESGLFYDFREWAAEEADKMRKEAKYEVLGIVEGCFNPDRPRSAERYDRLYAAINFIEYDVSYSYINVRGSYIGNITSTNRNAYPDNGEKDGYWYVYEGVANAAPTISGRDEDLGGFKAPFKKSFSVNDPDRDDSLKVVIKLNGAVIRTINNATRGESYEVDIDKEKFDRLELNKENTIEITVSDSNGSSSIRRYKFKKVNSNPVLSLQNKNMGEQNKPFSFSFKGNDPDGDDIKAKIFIDDEPYKDLGGIEREKLINEKLDKITFAKLKNGKHKIRIELSDTYGAKSVDFIEFSKNISYCWYRLTKEVDDKPSAIVVNPLCELAKGAKLVVKVSLNARDNNPTWEIVPDELIGQKYNFKTKEKTADKWCIGVDVRIDRDKTPDGFNSYFYGFVGAYL